jgi:hypothetical protein
MYDNDNDQIWAHFGGHGLSRTKYCCVLNINLYCSKLNPLKQTLDTAVTCMPYGGKTGYLITQSRSEHRFYKPSPLTILPIAHSVCQK